MKSSPRALPTYPAVFLALGIADAEIAPAGMAVYPLRRQLQLYYLWHCHSHSSPQHRHSLDGSPQVNVAAVSLQASTVAAVSAAAAAD